MGWAATLWLAGVAVFASACRLTTADEAARPPSLGPDSGAPPGEPETPVADAAISDDSGVVLDAGVDQGIDLGTSEAGSDDSAVADGGGAGGPIDACGPSGCGIILRGRH